MSSEVREIEPYEGKYRIWSDGRVERRTAAERWVEVKQFGDPPRVTLFRLGQRWRPYVKTLLDRVGFGA